jgi:hypothetical protein
VLWCSGETKPTLMLPDHDKRSITDNRCSRAGLGYAGIYDLLCSLLQLTSSGLQINLLLRLHIDCVVVVADMRYANTARTSFLSSGSGLNLSCEVDQFSIGPGSKCFVPSTK